MDWVISRELSQSSSYLLVDNGSEVARSRSVESEDTKIATAGSITESSRSACTLVQNVLKNPALPAIIEISVVSKAVRVPERVDVWLSRVHRIGVPVGIPCNGVQVSLNKDTRDGNRVSGVITCSTVWSSRRKCNMGFVVSRVDVHAIPAHRKVNLSTDAARTRDRRKRVVSC